MKKGKKTEKKKVDPIGFRIDFHIYQHWRACIWLYCAVQQPIWSLVSIEWGTSTVAAYTRVFARCDLLCVFGLSVRFGARTVQLCWYMRGSNAEAATRCQIDCKKSIYSSVRWRVFGFTSCTNTISSNHLFDSLCVVFGCHMTTTSASRELFTIILFVQK